MLSIFAFKSNLRRYTTASYLWDDPSLAPELALSVPGGAGDLGGAVPLADEHNNVVNPCEKAEDAWSWSQMTVVRYTDVRQAPALLRLRVRRGGPGRAGGAGAAAVLVIEEVDAQGRVVQVDPIKPKLKAPEHKRLKLECDILLSTAAFKFKLRRYSKGRWAAALRGCTLQPRIGRQRSHRRCRRPGSPLWLGLTLVPVSAQLELFCPPFNPTPS